MNSDAPLDIETVKKNAIAFANLHGKASSVLRSANGRRDYKQISKMLGIPAATTSVLLSDAKRLGLAEKIGKFYKKKPGILKWVPKAKIKTTNKVTPLEIAEKIMKRKLKAVIPNTVSFKLNLNDQTVARMMNAYGSLYVTENVLRELIREAFKNEKDWWSKRVNGGIKSKVADAIKEYPYDGASRKDELEHTHLGQLKEIIIAKNNWEAILPFLKERDKNKFAVTVDRAIPSRNSIAHSTPLTHEDSRVVDVRFKDILKMLK